MLLSCMPWDVYFLSVYYHMYYEKESVGVNTTGLYWMYSHSLITETRRLPAYNHE